MAVLRATMFVSTLLVLAIVGAYHWLVEPYTPPGMTLAPYTPIALKCVGSDAFCIDSCADCPFQGRAVGEITILHPTSGALSPGCPPYPARASVCMDAAALASP